MYNQPSMVKKIISTLEDPHFHAFMYNQCMEDKSGRIEHLIDLYLNTPEKGCFETPLHLAAKHGFVGKCLLQWITLLLSYIAGC